MKYFRLYQVNFLYQPVFQIIFLFCFLFSRYIGTLILDSMDSIIMDSSFKKRKYIVV